MNSGSGLKLSENAVLRSPEKHVGVRDEKNAASLVKKNIIEFDLPFNKLF